MHCTEGLCCQKLISAIIWTHTVRPEFWRCSWIALTLLVQGRLAECPSSTICYEFIATTKWMQSICLLIVYHRQSTTMVQVLRRSKCILVCKSSTWSLRRINLCARFHYRPSSIMVQVLRQSPDESILRSSTISWFYHWDDVDANLCARCYNRPSIALTNALNGYSSPRIRWCKVIELVSVAGSSTSKVLSLRVSPSWPFTSCRLPCSYVGRSGSRLSATFDPWSKLGLITAGQCARRPRITSARRQEGRLACYRHRGPGECTQRSTRRCGRSQNKSGHWDRDNYCMA